jgi:aminomuconate-semialdehyde/2-hydroxymuconate-6-semialdehyde dehydrogenase
MTKFLRNYINGRWAETGRTCLNINPVNGSKVGDVSEADHGAVDQAVKGARAAMAGAHLTSREALPPTEFRRSGKTFG